MSKRKGNDQWRDRDRRKQPRPYRVDYKARKIKVFQAQACIRNAGAEYEKAVAMLNSGAACWLSNKKEDVGGPEHFFEGALAQLAFSVTELTTALRNLRFCIQDMEAECASPERMDERVIALRLRAIKGIHGLMEIMVQRIGRFAGYLEEEGSGAVYAGFCDQAGKGKKVISMVRNNQRFWLALQARVFQAGILAQTLLTDPYLLEENEDAEEVRQIINDMTRAEHKMSQEVVSPVSLPSGNGHREIGGDEGFHTLMSI